MAALRVGLQLVGAHAVKVTRLVPLSVQCFEWRPQAPPHGATGAPWAVRLQLRAWPVTPWVQLSSPVMPHYEWKQQANDVPCHYHSIASLHRQQHLQALLQPPPLLLPLALLLLLLVPLLQRLALVLAAMTPQSHAALCEAAR